MSTLIASTVAAIVALLQASPAVAAQVDRSRLRPYAKEISQGLVVRPVQAEAADGALGNPGLPIKWVSTIAVDCYQRSTASTAPDAAVDNLVAGVYTRLLTDPTLGGVALWVQPKAVSYDFDTDGEQTTCVTLHFHVHQRTSGAIFS